MRSLIVAAFVALPVLAGAAVAEEPRMSNTEFSRASQCLAHVNLTMLQSDRPNVDSLTARMNYELTIKSNEAKRRANSLNRRVYVNALQADTPAEIEKMRARRDRHCAPFLAPSTVAQASGS